MKSKSGNSSIKAIVEFIIETGLLKRVERSGWSVVGIKNAESVADHSFRCAVIGFFLAQMEKVRPDRVLLMTLFNDSHEARITDLHKMAQRYFNIEKAEDDSFIEQVKPLPKKMREKLLAMRKEYRKQKSPESIIARDADILECLMQAKEYESSGYRHASQFMKKAPRFLRTESARKLWTQARKANPNNWWLKLSEFKR